MDPEDTDAISRHIFQRGSEGSQPFSARELFEKIFKKYDPNEEGAVRYPGID
jgi:hypothetical protein